MNIFSGGALGEIFHFGPGHHAVHQRFHYHQPVRGAHIFPALDRMHKEGEAGRRKENQITRIFTLFLAALQGSMMTFAITKVEGAGGVSAVVNPSFFFFVTTVLTLCAGTMFVMWLGEQITEKAWATVFRSSSLPVSWTDCPAPLWKWSTRESRRNGFLYGFGDFCRRDYHHGVGGVAGNGPSAKFRCYTPNARSATSFTAVRPAICR